MACCFERPEQLRYPERNSAGDNIPDGIEKQGREERRKKKIRDERK